MKDRYSTYHRDDDGRSGSDFRVPGANRPRLHDRQQLMPCWAEAESAAGKGELRARPGVEN